MEQKKKEKRIIVSLRKHIVSKCHSQAFRYPVVKSWFLERYPEIMEFGLKEKEENVILQMPKNNEDEIVEKKYA